MYGLLSIWLRFNWKSNYISVVWLGNGTIHNHFRFRMPVNFSDIYTHAQLLLAHIEMQMFAHHTKWIKWKIRNIPSPRPRKKKTSNASSPSNRTFEELAILPNGTVNEAYRPLTISMYHLHMHRWLEVFSRDQLLVVNGDRLIEDPVSQLRRIETFLGMYHFYHFAHLLNYNIDLAISRRIVCDNKHYAIRESCIRFTFQCNKSDKMYASRWLMNKNELEHSI